MPRPDGTPTISEMWDEFDNEEDTREDKNWPPEEDCPCCPSHKDGPHKMSCSMVKQLRVREGKHE